jgi:acyl dehydratase
MTPLYLEDLHVGQRFTSGTYHLTAAEIKAFATEFDPQSFHLDDSAANASLFQGLAASGWHTGSIAMRLMVTGGLPFASGVINVAGEITWPKPTRPGDILHLESEIVEIKASRTKPMQGMVTVKNTMLNQSGEPVLQYTGKVLVFRKA